MTVDTENDNQADLPAADEGPTEPVEVEIEAEGDPAPAAESDPAPAAAADAPAADADKKKKDRRTVRVENATRRAVEAETKAERLERELEELRQQAQRDGTRAVTADRAALANYERAVNAEEKLAAQELRDAIASGDPDKQAEAQTRVAKVAAERTNLDAWKAQQPKPKTKPAAATDQRRERQPDQRREPEVHPQVKAWVADNPWFEQGSADFDPEMHEFAVTAARQVELRYARAGKADKIGSSPEYFADVDKLVRSEFPDYFADETPPTRDVPPMTRSGVSNVAPVSRSGGAISPGGAPSPTRVTLSADERRMAHSLADSGAITHPDGKRMTHAEAEKHYAVQKYKTQTQRSA